MDSPTLAARFWLFSEKLAEPPRGAIVFSGRTMLVEYLG